jgi:hypothetical protein
MLCGRASVFVEYRWCPCIAVTHLRLNAIYRSRWPETALDVLDWRDLATTLV